MTLECLCFSCVNVPVEDQGDLGMFVFFIGPCPVEDQSYLGKFVFFMG